MKNKIFKISVILVVILTMTMTNFVFVGSSLISYALDNNNSTNNNNVEFNAYFKNEKGDKVSNLDILGNNAETMLYLYLNVKQEGYFNGTVHLEEGANFKLKETENQYIKSIESNTIYLHNITAGTSIEIPVKIEPIKNEIYEIGLLDVQSKININGIYRDSSEKDKKINATKTVELKLTDGITQENIINQASIITNKISNIDGEEKRILQLSWDIGLKENNYPIQEIVAKIKVPTVGEEPQIGAQVALNTMTSNNYQYEEGFNKITLTNDKTKEGTVTWKKEGTENIILTYIFDKNVELNNVMIEPEIEMTLYNKKEFKSTSQLILNQEEKDSIVEIITENQENEIYKGKLMAGIDRQYSTKTSVKVNLAKIVKEIEVQEDESTYTVNGTENTANSFYSQTLIAKEQFDQILGTNGSITIMNQANQVIGIINAETKVNEKGEMVIDYGNSQTKQIKIQITQPIKEGTLEINHVKNIKETQKQIVKEASRLHTSISSQYNKGQVTQVENNINLKDTVTESKIAVDAQQLSTVVNNPIEMKVTLLSNEEKYDLYENPKFTITLPNQVEDIKITNISKLYDDNNEFGNTIQYAINDNNINLVLNGKQTNYTSTVEGITIVLEVEIQVNKTAATSDQQIVMTYQNDNAVSYANHAVASTPIKITAPKEITAVNRIQDLSVETIGEEEKTEVMMEKGTSAKQIVAEMEIINSNVVAINDVKVLGNFPTDDSENNMGIAITGGIQVEGANQAKVYYSANENATDDISNTENGWSENLNSKEAKTYLILLDSINAQSNVQATYQMTIPENLSYNKVATEGYSVSATNSETGTGIELDATTIAMQTGVGPQVESKIQAVVGTDVLKANDVVKNGEVIKYQVNVANTGTEEAANLTIVGNVPEGTTLVQPMNHYEYTGAAYYQENTEAKSYTTTIESLKAGESKTVEYEVRINSDVQAGTKITNETEVQYGEAKTKSSMTNVTDTSNVRVSLKRISDRSIDIYNGDYITYYAIIENMSNTEQKDVTIQTNLSDNAEVEKIALITGMEVKEVTDEDLGESDIEKEANSVNTDNNQNEDETEQEYEEAIEEEEEDDEIVLDDQQQLQYQKEVNIGNLNGGETKVLYYVIKTKSAKDDNIVTMSLLAKANTQIGRSNVWKDTILYYNIEADMKTNTQSQFVQMNDEIDYHITVKNTNTADSRTVKIIDEIPNDLEIQSIIVDGKEKEIPENSNKVKISTMVKAQSEMDITIKTLVDEHQNTEAKTISNVATVEEEGDVLATTSEITHIIKSSSNQTASNDTDSEDEDQDSDTTNDTNNNTQNNNQNVTQGSNMIAGTAWMDADIDGMKDSGEPLLSNIKVKLLNVETNEIVKDNNGNEITTTTNSNGIYILQNIANGKYILIFEYDTTKYGLTTYRASGVSESENSNAVMNELNINRETKKIASTDIITVEDTDIANINIGLIELKNFDLQLEKGISRILIQNASGTTVRQYGNVDMAKIELDAKKIKGSTVLIEYQIVLRNVGEVDGYVKKVVDYMPSDLKFSSELNKDWYQTNGVLYNASLANDKIAAGESKTITLTLTKSMTENNTGLTRNVAEIAEDYNEIGLKDSNSTPGNKAEGENDMSSAEVIISIRTGAIIYVSIVIVMIVIGIAIAFIIIKRKKQNKEEII